MEKDDIIKMVEELLEAKDAVLYCINNPKGSVNMHGLSYWAESVEYIREKLNDLL